jgi:hypothetical protein
MLPHLFTFAFYSPLPIFPSLALDLSIVLDHVIFLYYYRDLCRHYCIVWLAAGPHRIPLIPGASAFSPHAVPGLRDTQHGGKHTTT